jgi:hypothetical protein
MRLTEAEYAESCKRAAKRRERMGINFDNRDTKARAHGDGK